MGKHVDRQLRDGEQVLHEGQLHWLTLVDPGLLVALALAIGAVSSKPLLDVIANAALVAAALLFCAAVAAMLTTELTVTNRRVIMRAGVIRRKATEQSLLRIEAIELGQTVVGRLLGYGTVTVHASGGSVKSFRFIADPQGFKAVLGAAMDRRERSLQLARQAAF